MNAKPLPGFRDLPAAKAEVETQELKGTGIIVNCVAPGAIDTEIFREFGDMRHGGRWRSVRWGGWGERRMVPVVRGFGRRWWCVGYWAGY